MYKTDNHPYRTSTSGGVPFGSGLNTLSNYPWVDFQRIEWDTCSDISAQDCLTPKGFTAMRVRLEEGVYLDFYNVHADAGYVLAKCPSYTTQTRLRLLLEIQKMT